MTTTTYTRREVDAAECILDEFSYWPSVPQLSAFRSVDELRRTYQYQGGPAHYFDREAMRFFGSRNLHMHRPGLMVETQTNSPEGVHRYKVTAWVYDETETNGARLTPQCLGRCETLAEARKLAEAACKIWGQVQQAHRLRAAGAPGDALELLEVLGALS